jgi:hypothetical protein
MAAQRLNDVPEIRSAASRGHRAPCGQPLSGAEVDEQLIDAFSLVVMDPVRRVGQALDAVEVGHVVALGLGEVGAETRSWSAFGQSVAPAHPLQFRPCHLPGLLEQRVHR